MDDRLAKTYYNPSSYWRGLAVIKKLAEAAKVSEDAAKKWLVKQALWQIYLSPPQHVPRPWARVHGFCFQRNGEAQN